LVALLFKIPGALAQAGCLPLPAADYADSQFLLSAFQISAFAFSTTGEHRWTRIHWPQKRSKGAKKLLPLRAGERAGVRCFSTADYTDFQFLLSAFQISAFAFSTTDLPRRARARRVDTDEHGFHVLKALRKLGKRPAT
jgi:hypothetical protein